MQFYKITVDTIDHDAKEWSTYTCNVLHKSEDAALRAFVVDNGGQLYWTTSPSDSVEVQAEDQNILYHVRLHNVISAL